MSFKVLSSYISEVLSITPEPASQIRVISNTTREPPKSPAWETEDPGYQRHSKPTGRRCPVPFWKLVLRILQDCRLKLTFSEAQSRPRSHMPRERRLERLLTLVRIHKMSHPEMVLRVGVGSTGRMLPCSTSASRANRSHMIRLISSKALLSH